MEIKKVPVNGETKKKTKITSKWRHKKIPKIPVNGDTKKYKTYQ